MIRLLLAEDQHIVRAALRALLDLETDLEVVAQVERGDEVLDVALRTRPDVAVLDIDLPGLDGLSAAEQVHAQLPGCRVLVLTGLGRPAHFVRALQVGVAGFLPKDARPGELASAIRRIVAGERVLDRDMVAAARATGPNPLSGRETAVLATAAAGGSTEEIGRQLHLSPITVRNYLSRAITKLDARNRTDAIRIAREAGWIR